MPITFSALQASVGKSIADLCPNNFSTPAESHCAHYVSHMLDLRLGLLCGDMAYTTRRSGASIRVDEIYNRLLRKGPWVDCPDCSDGLLIFVTSPQNMTNGVMRSAPAKHVGIHYAGTVFHFSNSLHKVVTDPSVEAFHSKFQRAYGRPDLALYFGAAQ